MGLDVVLVMGFILVVFTVPALVSAWSDNRPMYFRLGVLVLALLMMLTPYLIEPTEFHPRNWVNIALHVAARIIP